MAEPKKKLPVWMRALHYGILLNFVVQIAYAAYVVFVVLAPTDGGGPLWARAAEVDMDLLARRRLYAIEFWIAFSGFAIYLGLTEIAPRLREERSAD